MTVANLEPIIANTNRAPWSGFRDGSPEGHAAMKVRLAARNVAAAD